MDHLPSVRHLRVQVVTNSKGYVELNLNHRGLRIVPPETFQLTNTQVLRLDQNYIDYLPTMIAYLRGLRVLDLQQNCLVHLPETLVNCKHLAELRLTRNRLASLPRSFGGLKNLRILELGENQLEQLPHEVGLLHSLRTLDLHSNKLWHLPFSLQELRHLLNLNLSDNMFDHVPLVVTKITSLRALNLSRNRLGSLPLDFDALKGLRELNLSHNKLQAVSSVLVTLRHLKYLSLASNDLKFLPSQMSHLQNLRVLHLQGNELRHVPSCLRRLRFYNVSANRITAFSVEGMRSLVSITASKNRLETVPRGLYKLKQLKFLSLDCNILVEIGEQIGNLKQLRVLNLSHNNLQGLPKALHQLPLLQTFNIKGNYSLTKKKSQERLKNIDSKMNEEKYKEYIKTMKESKKKKLLSRKGALSFKEDENDDYDEDDDDGIWMNEDLRKPGKLYQDLSAWNTNMNVGDKYHISGGKLMVSRSAKSLDDLNRDVMKHRQPLNGHHHVAGELSGRSTERKRQHLPYESHQAPSKMFLGRGVVLPSKDKQATMKRMASTNLMNQSNSRKETKNDKMKKDRHEKGSNENKKSKFNKSVKSLKELIFGTKTKNKEPREELKPKHHHNTVDTTQMKTSNSVNLPFEYTADEVDRGWRSRRTSSDAYSVRNSTMRSHSHRSDSNERASLHGRRGFETHDGEGSSRYNNNNYNNRHHHKMTRHASDCDVSRDRKSTSHGYGSWRSRTQQMFWEEDEWTHDDDDDDHTDRSNVVNMADETRKSNKIKSSFRLQNNNKSKLNRKRSCSSDTVASDFTYQKFGGKPDRAPSRQSSNASRYRIEKQNNYYTTYGNDRYSVMSGHGSLPRPSSRSKYLGQWFGPDYESSFTVGSDEETEHRSFDYSVREAKASFATETTMGTHNQNKQWMNNLPHQYGGSYSQLDMIHEDKNYPTNQQGRSYRRRQRSSSVESLVSPGITHNHNSNDDHHQHYHHQRHYSQSQEFLPLIENRSAKHYPNHHMGHRRYISNDQSDFSDISGYKSDSHLNVLHRGEYNNVPEYNGDEENGWVIQESESSNNKVRLGLEEENQQSYHDNRLGQNTPENKGVDSKFQKFNPFSRSKSFSEFDNVLTTNHITEKQSQISQSIGKTHEGINSSLKDKTSERNKQKKLSGTVNQLDENFALRKKSEIPRSKSMNSLNQQATNDEKTLPPFGMTLTPLPGGYGTLARSKSVSNKQTKEQTMNRTDYTLLGVCNQIETMLNKNLLQPVIGFKGSHKFEDKTIEEKSKGVWRLGDSFDRDDVENDNNNDDDNDDRADGKPDVLETTLEYSQPQTFKVTSTGGQFVTCERPEVKVTVPAHSVSKSLQVTIQMLNISPVLLNQAKSLNHFIDNITAIGPVVYFYLTEEQKLNSPTSFTLPAPASMKGSHLAVLTIKRDNSCMPCNSSYRSSKLEVSLSAWHFSAKVAVLTQAKCKYKACKSVEMLLQCIGANQV